MSRSEAEDQTGIFGFIVPTGAGLISSIPIYIAYSSLVGFEGVYVVKEIGFSGDYSSEAAARAGASGGAVMASVFALALMCIYSSIAKSALRSNNDITINDETSSDDSISLLQTSGSKRYALSTVGGFVFCIISGLLGRSIEKSEGRSHLELGQEVLVTAAGAIPASATILCPLLVLMCLCMFCMKPAAGSNESEASPLIPRSDESAERYSVWRSPTSSTVVVVRLDGVEMAK